MSRAGPGSLCRRWDMQVEDVDAIREGGRKRLW